MGMCVKFAVSAIVWNTIGWVPCRRRGESKVVKASIVKKNYRRCRKIIDLGREDHKKQRSIDEEEIRIADWAYK